MDTVRDMQLKESMRGYLDTFFLSLQGDTKSLSSFTSTLSAFTKVVRSHHDKLQEETLVAVQGFLSVIDTVSFNIMDVEKKSEKLGDQTLVDLTRILDEQMGDLTIHDEHEAKLSKTSLGTFSHFPAYIEPSYEWLLSNLHNPYPSKEVKKAIARRSKSSLRDIDSWFIDARKRIGWNTLRRQHFSNKQEKIIAAATRFFHPSPLTFADDISSTLEVVGDFHDAYHAHFIAMENAARCLYSGRFVDLSSPISSDRRRDQKTTVSAKADGRREQAFVKATEAGKSKAPLPDSIYDTILSYPTPQPSPEHSAELSSPVSAPLSLPTLSHMPSRKRRQTLVEPPEGGPGDNSVHPRKRFRHNVYEYTETIELTTSGRLPSPALTIDSSRDASDTGSQSTVPPSHSAPSASQNPAKRKRRLSDGDSRRPAKRPHHALAVPRLQAVSDPFPIPKPFKDDSIDEWFYDNFSAELQLTDIIPSPASLRGHDLPVGIPLEVHCDMSPYQLAITQPQTPFLAHDNIVSPEVLCPSISEGVSKSSTAENLLISNSLPDFNEINAAEVVSADELSLSLDFGFPFTVEGTKSRDTPFNHVDQMRNFDPLLQLPSPDFDWAQFPLAGSVNAMELPTSFVTENPSIFDFDSIIHKDTIIPEDQDVKRLRLQFLREELQLLESQIDP